MRQRAVRQLLRWGHIGQDLMLLLVLHGFLYSTLLSSPRENKTHKRFVTDRLQKNIGLTSLIEFHLVISKTELPECFCCQSVLNLIQCK